MLTFEQSQVLSRRRALTGPARAAWGKPPAPGQDAAPLHHNCSCGGGCPRCRAAAALRSAGVEPGASVGAGAAAPVLVGEEDRASGRPLDREVRSYMESRFGHDFGSVRVHTDTAASRSADVIGAKAYTSGNQIVFGTGQHSPGTHAGRLLLAHELVHTLQHRSTGPARQGMPLESHPAEVEARSVSSAVMEGRPRSPVRVAAALSPGAVAPQLDPRKVYCALHAAVCLGLSENPPAAALCWANFAARCGGALASAQQAEGTEAVADAAPAGAIPDEGAVA